MSTTERQHGAFVTFEGIDGCGKSTQIRLLAEHLRGEGHRVVEAIEPGGTAIGRQIRRVLLDASNREITPIAELLLYFASRAQNVEEVIRPALAEASIVLCDRFTDSTVVYQGFARGLGEQVVADLNRVACGGLSPELTVYLEIDLETSLARAHARNQALSGDDAVETRMDEQSVAFYRQVREGYQILAAREPKRWLVIDGNREPPVIAAEIFEAVRSRIDV